MPDANPPSLSADRARVEAVRATLLVQAEKVLNEAICVTTASWKRQLEEDAAALREAATWAPPGDEGLRAALEEYGQHKGNCNLRNRMPFSETARAEYYAKGVNGCTCGLSAVLAAMSPLHKQTDLADQTLYEAEVDRESQRND